MGMIIYACMCVGVYLCNEEQIISVIAIDGAVTQVVSGSNRASLFIYQRVGASLNACYLNRTNRT